MIRPVFLLLALTLPIIAQIPAFPGAQGFGAYATGGRGGDVYHVTNLNNNGAGSLRAGLNTAPPEGRTIVFAVSGYIPVVSDTNFNVPSKVTIAGQTAPGDGVGLRGGRMLISGSDVVMRHFRIRHGKNGTGGDCLNIASTAQRTMLDHISMMFSTDENFSFFNSSVNHFTMQYSNSTWGMERHNAGGLWDLQNGSCHHTLWAHHRTRNPKARPSMLEWINNVTFHWRNEGFIMGDSQTPANWKANVRGCYYISIDDADDGSTLKSTGLTKATVASNGVPNFSLHLDDTLYDNNDNGILDGTDRGYGIVSGAEFTPGDAVGANRYYKSAIPFTGATGAATVAVDDPLTAYKKVLSSAAPLRLDANYTGDLRDELDDLLVDSVVNQYSILVQKDGKVAGEDPARTNNGEQLLADRYGITNNGFGTLNGTTPPTDSDLDGMPDFWELALNGQNGIAYNVVADDHNNAFTGGQLPNTFFPAGTPVGYTYLEEYLHFKAIPHATVARNTAGAPSVQVIDLAKYTDAFTAAPVFSISGIANGSVQQFLANGTTPSAGGPVVKFTPTPNFTGRAGFNFTVTDADGSQWTQPFALLVTSNAAPRDLVWIGDSGANLWDDISANWQTTSGSGTVFSAGDTALFDDRGSASPAVNVDGSRFTGSLLVTSTKAYTFAGTGSIASTGALTKASDSNLTLVTPASFASGTFLNGGNTILNNGGNLAGGAIQFTGGSSLTDNTGSNYLTLTPDIKVSAGATGNLNLSPRIELDGSLSGGGTFNIHSPSTLGTEGRAYLDGASAGCTGTVNLTGGATAPGNGGRIAMRALSGSFNGFPNARIHLSGIDLFTQNYSSGNTYEFGELAGDANSRIRGAYNSSGITTLSAGQLGTDSEFAGVITDGAPSATGLSKYGAGKLTLSGNNTYSGVTAIYGGTLEVLGSLGATNVFVGGGAKLSGSGPVGNVLTVQTDGRVAPGNSPGTAGTMTAAGGLALNSGCHLEFDLTSNAGGSNDRILVPAGSLAQTGTINFHFNLLDGYLNAGTYTLVSGAPNSSASSVNLTHDFPASTRQGFAMGRSSTVAAGPKSIWLTVSGTPGDLTWTGAGGSTWDLNGTTNFSNGPGGDNKFYNLDRVSFTGPAATGTVALNGTLQPREVTVNNGTGANLGFNGVSGTLAGTGSLVKTGAGTLTVTPNPSGNTYSGGTFLSGGVLAVAGNSPLGNGPIHLGGGTLNILSGNLYNPMLFSGSSAIATGGNSAIVGSNASTMTSTGDATVNLSAVAGVLTVNGDMTGFSGTLDFGSGSGTLRLNWNGSPLDDRNFGSATTLFHLGTAGARLNNRNGDKTIHLGGLEGGPGTRLEGRQTGNGPTTSTYVVGALGTNQSFAGTIADGGDDGGLFLVKTGAGTWTLGGSSNFIGGVTVEQGTLALSGTLACSGSTGVNPGAVFQLLGGTLATASLDIAAGATLRGAGTIDGELLNNGSVEVDSGDLTVTGSVINNGTMRIKGGAKLSTSQTVQNHGILDLLTAGAGLPPNLENYGVVIDSSGMKVTHYTINGTNFELGIQTYSGHSYQLQRSGSMLPGSWDPIGDPVAGDDTPKTFVDIGGISGDKRFYRVKVD